MGIQSEFGKRSLSLFESLSTRTYSNLYINPFASMSALRKSRFKSLTIKDWVINFENSLTGRLEHSLTNGDESNN